MKNLKPFEGNCEKVFTDIINSKREPRKRVLQGIADRVQLRFSKYGTNTLTLQNLNQIEFTDEETDALLHCYESATKHLTSMIAQIRNLQEGSAQAICQYCGLNEPLTEDHYVPKSKFPEFAAFGLNLVPCCSVCNSKKSHHFTEDEELQFINLYFDAIPTQRYLFATVDIDRNLGLPVASFEVKNINQIDANVFSKIEAHFRHLELTSRYRKITNTYVAPLIESMLNNRPLNSSLISHQLRNEFNIQKNYWGANHWKPVLAEGLRNSADFEAYLLSK